MVNVHGRSKADRGEALLTAALEGVGIAMLPDVIIDPHIRVGALVPVLCDYPPPEAGLYILRRRATFRCVKCVR